MPRIESAREWMRRAVSVWSDIQKAADELNLEHPAPYPVALAVRILECYLDAGPGVVLDPFLGSGSTLLAARRLGLSGVGFEIAPEFARLAYRRIAGLLPLERPDIRVEAVDGARPPVPIRFRPDEQRLVIVHADAARIPEFLPEESVDIAVTSPPYWNVLRRRRSVLGGAPRPYSDLPEDLGNADDYQEFLRRLAGIFQAAIRVLKPGAFFVVVAGDVRVGSSLVPLHADLIGMMAGLGARLADLIIWDRRREYNNLRPIGYPRRFIACRIHEYVLAFRKPAPSGPGSAGGRGRARVARGAPDGGPGAARDAESEALAGDLPQRDGSRWRPGLPQAAGGHADLGCPAPARDPMDPNDEVGDLQQAGRGGGLRDPLGALPLPGDGQQHGGGVPGQQGEEADQRLVPAVLGRPVREAADGVQHDERHLQQGRRPLRGEGGGRIRQQVLEGGHRGFRVGGPAEGEANPGDETPPRVRPAVQASLVQEDRRGPEDKADGGGPIGSGDLPFPLGGGLGDGAGQRRLAYPCGAVENHDQVTFRPALPEASGRQDFRGRIERIGRHLVLRWDLRGRPPRTDPARGSC
jgi:DNA modification methylase